MKAGSVIEYRYTLRSPFYYNPENFQFQRSIPVKYSFLKITIPEYFEFNRGVKGYDYIKTNSKATNSTFHIGGQALRCLSEEITAEVSDLTALKDENFIWNCDDFMTGISFSLRRVVIVGVYEKNYAASWDKVVEGLMENDNFGGKLKNKGLFKDELAIINKSEVNDEEKLRAILNLVRGKVKWNERNAFYIINPSKALKDGVGSSAEINSLLFNAVKNAGYDAGVVAMSLRSNGRIPISYISRDNFNYFIVQVKVGDKTYYMDATRSYCDLNVIPVNCLVDKGLCINETRFDWEDLTKIGNNISRANIIASFDENGILIGEMSKVRTGESVASFKQNYDKAKDDSEHITSLEKNNDIVISDYSIEDKQVTVIETYKFKSNSIRLEDEIIVTIQPLLFETMQRNPFKQEERKLPIEFNYPEDERINVIFSIPAGYALDEVPKQERLLYGDNNLIDFSYLVRADEKNVQIAYRFKLGTCIIPSGEYAELRSFISKVYAKSQEVLVFKKL